ncbi:TPA: chromosome partitioning protein ParB, partial [Neisseria meningitidis]
EIIMNGLKADRPSANKANLSIDDVIKQEEIKRISFDMSESLHRELKKYAAENGVTIRVVLNKLVSDLLNK